jgi:flagellar biosynthesis/type III secretory pathway M-ring protein FliF/YscJ
MPGLIARWRALSTRDRLLASGLVCAAVLAFGVALLLQRDARVELFAEPLHPEQVTEVVERLAEWSTPFVAEPDNVRVDGARRNDLLLKLSLAGVPHAHLGGSREELEKTSPLTPQSVLDAQARDGLADDLAAGLRGLPGVADARVIIAPAKPGAFVDEPSHDASASVRITLVPGATLSRATAEGIRAFVAAGVPGLDASHVALLDDRGSALRDGPDSAPDAGDLQTSLQSALDAAFGAGATIVRLRVAYDARASKSDETIAKPLPGALRASDNDERYANDGRRYSRSSTNEERGSDVEETRIDVPAGRIERISAAIAVDAARALDLAKIRSLATGTLGLEPARGDTLDVEEVAFAHDAPQALAVPAIVAGLLSSLVPALLCAALAVAALRRGAAPFAKLCRALARSVSVRRTQRAVSGYAPAHVRGVLKDEPPHTAAAIISALPAATATAVLELYPPEERAQIVRRLAREASPAVPDFESVLRRG